MDVVTRVMDRLDLLCLGQLLAADGRLANRCRKDPVFWRRMLQRYRFPCERFSVRGSDLLRFGPQLVCLRRSLVCRLCRYRVGIHPMVETDHSPGQDRLAYARCHDEYRRLSGYAEAHEFCRQGPLSLPSHTTPLVCSNCRFSMPSIAKIPLELLVALQRQRHETVEKRFFRLRAEQESRFRDALSFAKEDERRKQRSRGIPWVPVQTPSRWDFVRYKPRLRCYSKWQSSHFFGLRRVDFKAVPPHRFVKNNRGKDPIQLFGFQDIAEVACHIFGGPDGVRTRLEKRHRRSQRCRATIARKKLGRHPSAQ